MPHDMPLIRDLLVILLASIPIAFIAHRLRLPLIVGFMVTGVLIGPHGLGLIKELAAVEVLAEIGVVLLMFVIGLEFSLRRILEMRRLVFLGGGLQVALTVLAAMLGALGLGQPLNDAIFIGFLFALSSTAIVLKSYTDRAEVDTPHGRSVIGVLLFQDLCAVLMMLFVPVLSGEAGATKAGIAGRLALSFGAIALIIFAARILVPRAFHYIVRLRSSEIFIIFVVLVSLGTSWLTLQFDLSLALGAFIAGLVISESEYSHQTVADILPFRDVFNSIFFISIGMLLSAATLARDWLEVGALVVALVAGKALIAALVIRWLGRSWRVAATAGLGLAQIGEFSFVMAKAGLGQGLMVEADYQRFLAASILSMIATPFLIKAAPRLGLWVQTRFAPGREFEEKEGEKEKLAGHVIIVGYGLNGRNLATVLRRNAIPYVVLELNAETVREAGRRGEHMMYGDSTRREVLRGLNLESARVLVLAISDPIATRHTVWLARQMNPGLHIIVRTRYMAELADLYKIGADQVIPEEFETSIEIFSRVLREYGTARNIIQREVEAIRREGYQMLRAPSLPLVEMSAIAEAFGTVSTETMFVERDAPAVGRTLGEIDLRRRSGATVMAAIRDGNAEINPGPDFRLAADDILVLLGSPEQVEHAIQCLTAGDGAAPGASSGGA